MKCMNKKVVHKKHELQAEKNRIAEEARWNSLTPEEQEKELAEREAKMQKGKQAIKDFLTIKSFVGGPY